MNIIDLRPYLALPAEEPQAPVETELWKKILLAVGKFIDSAASLAVALCICTCTLVFFTML